MTCHHPFTFVWSIAFCFPVSELNQVRYSDESWLWGAWFLNPHLINFSDAKHVIFGGLWDNSLRAYSVTKSKVVCSVVRHFDPITCLASDSSGSRHVMSGSRDTTSVVWEMSMPVGTSSVISLRPIQVNLNNNKAYAELQLFSKG